MANPACVPAVATGWLRSSPGKNERFNKRLPDVSTQAYSTFGGMLVVGVQRLFVRKRPRPLAVKTVAPSTADVAWLRPVYELVKGHRVRSAVHSIFVETTRLMREKRWEDCRELLERADFAQLEINTIVAVLTVTSQAREYLSRERQSFASRARVHLRTRGHSRDEIAQAMGGLD